MTAHVSSNKAVHEWHGEWASLDDLHTSAKVKSLLENPNALVLRAREGLKGKHASKGARYGQLRPNHNSVSPPVPISKMDETTANQMHVESK